MPSSARVLKRVAFTIDLTAFYVGMSFLLHSMWMKSLLGLDGTSSGRLANRAERLDWRDYFSNLLLLPKSCVWARFCSKNLLWRGDWITLPHRPVSLLCRYYDFCKFLTGCRLCRWSCVGVVRHGAEILVEIHDLFVGFSGDCFIFNGDCHIQEIYSLGWLFKFPFPFKYAKVVNFLLELFPCWFKLVPNPNSHDVVNKFQKKQQIVVKSWNNRAHFMDCKIDSGPHACSRRTHGCA